MSGCEKFDLCFGGRRDFCKSDYADLGNFRALIIHIPELYIQTNTRVPANVQYRQILPHVFLLTDGNMEDEEEMGPVMPKKSGPADFDELLRQATQKLKKK